MAKYLVIMPFLFNFAVQIYKEMLKLMLLVVLFCALSVLLLCVGVLLRKDGRFRSLHIGQSPHMRRHGIHCVQSMDRMMRRENPHRVSEHSTSTQGK